MKLLYLIISVLADDLYWIDYSTNSEFDWEILQSPIDHSISTAEETIYFNFGKNIEKTCGGQSASAIKFSKAGDSCEILGRHDLSFFLSTSDSSTILVFYEGGSLCRDKLWGDLKRKVEFKLICNDFESDFVLKSKMSDCTTVIERLTVAGCPSEINYGMLVKMTFIM